MFSINSRLDLVRIYSRLDLVRIYTDLWDVNEQLTDRKQQDWRLND